jgi:hypothetical protein
VTTKRRECVAAWAMQATHDVMLQHQLDGQSRPDRLCRGARRGNQPSARLPVRKPPLDPDVADVAPDDAMLTPYDYDHIVTYLRLLDANAEGADWREVSRIVLHIDPYREPARARRAHESHLARALWMASTGYRHLLRGDVPSPN